MSALPDPALSRAVLIGVSSYVHLEPLPAVANNLPALAHVLTSSGSWDLPEGHCTVVAEPDSTPAMLDAVQQAAEVAEDTLLIYFAGHGLLDGRGDLFFGLPRSTAGRSHTGVTYQALREILTDASAQRYVIILDCCMSGRALGSMSGDEMLADQAEIEGSYLLAAAPDNGLALAPPGETHTAFTGELLHLLRDGIPGSARDLDLDLVYRHLRAALGARGLPQPQKRVRNTAGRLILARNHAYRPPPANGPADPASTPWPDPGQCHTPHAFLQALAEVRAVSGHTLSALSQRADPPISAGSISALLNRTTLPGTWKTTGIYLTACGLPAEQADAWKAAWQRLRATEPATRPAPPAAGAAPAPRTWRARLGRGKRRP
ncbi:caspase family protein [Streptomyces griseorubiginosus]|uniref:caspase family protein n=1 Tax=Streptomyces griseorubiginosus TaxID=67304 RepID=UPI001AD78220|nr:caspase family protein [Streptomyces griseorubiginosus]MBO4259621.1 caspase family protein [Streptomyces griseorubiginosus]